VTSSVNKSTDDSLQPTILKNGTEAGAFNRNGNFLEKRSSGKCVICAEKDADDIFELVEQEKHFFGISGNDKIRESSKSGGKPEQSCSR